MCFVLSAIKKVVDSIAVGEHDAIIAPLVAQDINQQTVAGAAGLTLETLVGAHHLAHITFLYQSLKGGQVGFPQIAVGWLYVHRVAQGLWSAVYGIVLGTGVGFKVLIVVALHAQHGLNTQYGIQIGVLAAGFLSASPARVTEDVDVRTPEGKLWVTRIIGNAHGHIKQLRIVVVGTVPVGTGFVGHLREYIVEQLCIKGCCHTDGLWINRIAILTHAMTSLAPPVVAGDAQTVDRDRLVHHQSHLLLGCEQTQQVLNALFV